jgi:AraC-like DNA-binding protein
MQYAERRPVGRLRGIVDRLWLVDDATPSHDPELICPDGRPEIIVHLGDPMREFSRSGYRLQPRHLLVGQMASPIAVVATGRVAMAGARLNPDALFRLLPVSQDTLAGQVIDLASVWSRWTRITAEHLDEARTPEARLSALEERLEELLPPCDACANGSMRVAVTRLQATGGRASIAILARDMGISRRQFERRFREQVGLPPRLFGRIVKFQRAFHALGYERGAAVAAECGYADQAHLVREIRRFAGQTPTMLAEANGLTAFFRESTKMSQIDKPPR